jgi:2-polyprenyl-6-methoxyphenol hydroxylase-like FAD-dependent oxidoreductase
VTERARLTIGADGRNSRLARTVGARQHDGVAALTCWYFSNWGGDFEPEVAIRQRERNVITTFPTNDGLHAIFIDWPVAEFDAVRHDIGNRFGQALRAVPEFAERVAAGRQEERFYGTADLPSFYRTPFGPGWALVDDAGCHKDPYLALGIKDALRDAELLSDAAHAGLSGQRPMAEALAGYEAARNAASRADYRQDIEAAQFLPAPEQTRALFAALQGREEETRQFFLVRQGLRPPEPFFNPANLARIMGG